MRVVLGSFARSGIERYLGADLGAGIQAALVHYTRRMRSARVPVCPPRATAGESQVGPGVSFELPLDAEVRRAIEDEAEKQAATPEQLAIHAVLVYLADMDAADGFVPPSRVPPAAPEG